MRKRPSILILLGIAACVLQASGEELSYNRHIRPILSNNCFFCHGFDQNERKADLRLDVREAALASGAFVPGKPDESELIKRIVTTDEEDLMPPPDSHKKLSDRDKELLRQWIAQGAKYEGHWAYTPPARVETPKKDRAIDYLIEQRLEEIGLEKAPEADERTLIRRLYFDLVGLPPRPEDVEAFVDNSSPNAYAELVEKLLASPEHGERMAIGWLDVVRFADTIGYHSDNPRNIWPYRDYVIKAFHENKPFDQFTREQLAGDLLPDATQETRVASAFNRLLLSTEEGGAQAKDYEARMLTDRVRAVGTVWLGQTIGCAQCHDHKFDPITAKDFYSMGAFFADIQEPIIGRREPGMLVPTEPEAAKLTEFRTRLDQLQKKFDGPHPDAAPAFEQWQQEQLTTAALEAFWAPLRIEKAASAEGARLELQADNSVLAKGKKPDTDTYRLEIPRLPKGLVALRIEALPDDSLPSKGPGRAGNGNFVLSEVRARLVKGDSTRPVTFKDAAASFEQAFNRGDYKGTWAAKSLLPNGKEEGREPGWAILPEAGKAHQLVLQFAEPLDPQNGEVLVVEFDQRHGHGGHTLGKFRVSATSNQQAASATPGGAVSGETLEILTASKRGEAQDEKLFALFKKNGRHFQDLRDQIAAATKSVNDLEAAIARCLVSVSGQPRTVRILPRGNWMVDTGEIVQPALPEYLVKESPSEERRLTRLDLADWLVSRENPLTARVVMNRLWKQFFGTGLSKVLDDLGAQGEPPPNQALLDWLAVEFMDSGWDMRHMIRLVVNSDAYKRSSVPSRELRERDPFNRELAAQSRWRLDAELVRDNALSVAGLLVKKVGGPSVKPYQPDGYWENLNFPVRTYEHSTGAGQYRRGLYTWWQRSYLHPSMLAFDAPTREECAAERNLSNIPQQALVLLNDPTYVEASRAFATRILTEAGDSMQDRIQWAWKQALNRAPSSDEARAIAELVARHLDEYARDVESARALLSVGLNPAPANLEPAVLAAWTNAARVILNLHETITRS